MFWSLYSNEFLLAVSTLVIFSRAISLTSQFEHVFVAQVHQRGEENCVLKISLCSRIILCVFSDIRQYLLMMEQLKMIESENFRSAHFLLQMQAVNPIMDSIPRCPRRSQYRGFLKVVINTTSKPFAPPRSRQTMVEAAVFLMVIGDNQLSCVSYDTFVSSSYV